MTQEDVRAIRGLYDAFGRKDLPAIFAVLHPQVEFYQSALLPWAGSIEGRRRLNASLRH
jgi:ketosteroid isomerase-like protein